MDLDFDHVLPGHGDVVIGGAKAIATIIIPNIPAIKNIIKETLAAVLTPKEVAYVLIPNFLSPSELGPPLNR